MMRPYWRPLSGGLLALGAIASAGTPRHERLSPDDDALFAATVATVADSLHAIQRMIGGGAAAMRIGIDPRPMRVADDAGGDPFMTALARDDVVLDSLNARQRSDRVALLQAHGFVVGDAKAASQCAAGGVAPPGTTEKVPEPCALAPSIVGGLGVMRQTSREAKVAIIIFAMLPYKADYTADFTFAHNGKWRLVRTSLWTISE